MKRQLVEADAALESRKKPPEDTGTRIVGEGLVIDEWVNHFICLQSSYPAIPFYSCLKFSVCLLSHQKERRERYLAQQQGEGVDSL